MNSDITNDEALAKFNVWLEQFFAEVEPMEPEVTEILMKSFQIEVDNTAPFDELLSTFEYQLIDKRARFLQMQLTPALIAFLMYLCGSPGNCVMFLSAIRVKATTNNVSISRLCEIFPNGFPTKARMSVLWDLQKHGGANLLDFVDLRPLYEK